MENKILAKVGTLTVTEEEVNEFILSLGQRGQAYNTPEGRAMVLNQIIDSKLFLLDARRNLMEGEPEFRAELAKIKDKLLVNYAAEKALAAVKEPTDAEIEEYYNANPDKFSRPETVNASHILVDSEERALEILRDIKAGKISFEDAASAHSSCPSSERGGSLGDFTKGQMVPEFDTAVFSMAVGEVTDAPVQTQFGYHLIKLNSKTEGSVAPLAEVREGVKSMLFSDKQRRAYDSKVNQLKILFPVDILA